MPDAKRQIFVIEDDAKIAAGLAAYLEDAGYEAQLFPDARGVVDAVRERQPAAMLLDVMLPAGSGLDICRDVREFCDVPIMFLSARADEDHRIEGIEIGADDYVAKPFSPREVLVKVEALIRRSEGRVARDHLSRPMSIDQSGRRIAIGGHWLDLSPSEFEILATLAAKTGRVYSRAELLDKIGDHAEETGDRAIDSHIKNLRRKIRKCVDADNPVSIKAVYGSGYRLDRA